MRSSIVRALSTSSAVSAQIPTFGIAGNYKKLRWGRKSIFHKTSHTFNVVFAFFYFWVLFASFFNFFSHAEALHAAASRKNAKDAVATDIANLSEALKSEKISGFLSSAFIEKKTKMSVVNDVAAQLKMSPLVVNLLDLLAENHRLSHVPEIATVYR